MRPDVGPTACLSFEPDEARRLLWLPLAVRHKLDGCGLRLSLLEWQALPLDTRAELLHLPAGADFALCALHAGASRDTRLRQPVRLEAYEVAQALDCDAAAAGAWLAAATPFAHYVLAGGIGLKLGWPPAEWGSLRGEGDAYKRESVRRPIPSNANASWRRN